MTLVARGRIPSLDGLRAASVGLVLFSHLVGTAAFPVSSRIGNFFALGDLGVHVFFVISGFLITRLLLEELDRHGKIDLTRFYLRRTLRIFPPYFALLAVIALAQMAGWVDISSRDWTHAVTYTANYDAHPSWYVGHAWSLSVEEQFYLIWPACLFLIGRRGAAGVALAAIVVVPMIRFTEWWHWAAFGVGHRFETVADAIAAGCVLSCARSWLHEQRSYMKLLSSPYCLPITVALILAGNVIYDRPRVYYTVGMSLMNVAAAVVLDWCVSNDRGRVGRLLNWRPLAFVGTISYSLYLWQQLFLNRGSSAWAAAFPQNIVLVIAAGIVSYFAIERPALACRGQLERLLRPISQGRSQQDGTAALTTTST